MPTSQYLDFVKRYLKKQPDYSSISYLVSGRIFSAKAVFVRHTVGQQTVQVSAKKNFGSK